MKKISMQEAYEQYYHKKLKNKLSKPKLVMCMGTIAFLMMFLIKKDVLYVSDFKEKHIDEFVRGEMSDQPLAIRKMCEEFYRFIK